MVLKIRVSYLMTGRCDIEPDLIYETAEHRNTVESFVNMDYNINSEKNIVMIRNLVEVSSPTASLIIILNKELFNQSIAKLGSKNIGLDVLNLSEESLFYTSQEIPQEYEIRVASKVLPVYYQITYLNPSSRFNQYGFINFTFLAILPLKVFQIDAGWAEGNHNGQTNVQRFPQGMKFYADLIRSHGLIPGIWLSPFNFDQSGEIAKAHPHWFVKNMDGGLAVHGDYVMLDVTHPEAKEYVRQLYHKITYDWGYRYLKIDMVSDYMTAGMYHDPDAGALQNVREYFRLAREASHPDTYILACTSPIFEVAEFVDGMRVSVDIFERWESLIKEFNLTLKRYYMNGNLFINDPDCLMIRKKENEDEDCRRYCSRTDEEIRTFLTAIYAAGGALFLSDKLPLMKEAQIDQYARLFPVGDRTGHPLDLMDSFIPGVLDLGYDNDVRTVAFINWGERECTFRIDLAGLHSAVEHWTNEHLGRFEGAYQVTLSPHCSTLVHFQRL